MVVGLFMLVVPAQYDSVVVYTVGCLLGIYILVSGDDILMIGLSLIIFALKRVFSKK